MKALVTAALLAVALTTGIGAAHAAERGKTTAGDVIVGVDGDAADGFTIHFHDGSTLYPPTDSEARAECGEYDTVRARVRCRAEVRTWYDDLHELKRSLRWALAQ